MSVDEHRATPVPPTLHDVAREAGVSLATASRALNGSTRTVNETFRRRVLDAALRLNYTPNLSAQAVAKGLSSTISLLVSDIADPYFSSIAAGAIRAADEQRIATTMAVTHRDHERELELVRVLRGQRPRAIILTGSRWDGVASEHRLSDELAAYESTGGRVVLVSQRTLPFATVQLGNATGARELARELVGAGYRRFAVIAGDDRLLTSRERVSGFAEGLAEHGIAIHPSRVVRAEFTRDGGRQGAAELLQLGLDDVDLVFAVNDVMAIGAMSAFRAAGLRLPEDLAVAGYDDIATSRDVTPALTTVAVPLEAVGEHAVRLALDPATDSTTTEPVGATVLLRESTPPRA
ncbi:LacI family transcriptional regulator [Plantibacter flavus]|uniref:LacI family DNA-binding transcriptional regulator n=1 Tax=Plantibacter flavus TaxID=150123 RepID=UPI0010C15CB5|nr:LacI family DNA-binding transcriptional regulator [Plantibacter flavus]TKJ95460.1 LacI family transcriptional regulator [Plantibacter flavus]